jgi:3-oxoadipate enol-lactonase
MGGRDYSWVVAWMLTHAGETMEPTASSDLHAEVTGTGEPAVVLIHAGIADCRMWDQQVAVLARRYRVVRYDVRGFGRSPDPTVDFFDHADLLAVMATAGIERTVLVGASNGGRIALDTVVNAPDRVPGLVLIGSPLPGTSVPPTLQSVFEAEDTALREGDVDRAREINLRLWVDGVGRDRGDVPNGVRRTVGSWLETLLSRQAAQLQSDAGHALPVEPPIAERLGEIGVPTLVMVGQHDQPMMRAAAQRLAFGIAKSRLAVVEGAAHLVNVEQPQRCNALLEAFLGQVAGAAGTG